MTALNKIILQTHKNMKLQRLGESAITCSVCGNVFQKNEIATGNRYDPVCEYCFPNNKPDHKFCAKCEQKLHISKFSKNYRVAGGYHSYCKKCNNI